MTDTKLPEMLKFDDLFQLREFLNAFSDTELRTIWPDESDAVTLDISVETLSDGSQVQNFKFNSCAYSRF